MSVRALTVLGIRGIPARHGGFETFAEHLALFLVSRGWKLTVYCQDEGGGVIWEEEWNGIHLVHIPVRSSGAIGTVIFDWKSTLHAIRGSGLVLTLGYNTAVFCVLYRLWGRKNLINMDGIEWRRGKWGALARVWLYINERLGCWFGNHLIADHPEIKRHLSSRVSEEKITMIPYGADEIKNADPELLNSYNLDSKKFALVIARPEPENSLLEIVSAFSEKQRGFKLVVLGQYEPDKNEYHRKVMSAASDEVIFLGAVYDSSLLQALRFHCRLYVHGHQVGGTNPSLVEALGAGSPVLAHDNLFNRWVAGKHAAYFATEHECGKELERLLDDENALGAMRTSSRKRHATAFTWDSVLTAYEKLLSQ